MMDPCSLVYVSSGAPAANWKNPVCAPLFVKKFTVADPSGARMLISAGGFYDAYLNGKRITKGYLAPYTSNPDQVLFFDEYNLDGQITAGENTLCVLLGNGAANPFSGEIWNHHRQNIGPMLALEFECADLRFSAEDMGFTDSNILFDDLRAGVLCDMTRSVNTEALRKAVIARQPLGERRFTTCEPIREIRRIRARKIRPGALRDYRMRGCFDGMLYNGDTVMGRSAKSGGYIYDFGENNAGIPCLRIRGRRGQRIEMQFCELMHEGFADYINVDVYPDGCAQRDVYICSGNGCEEFIPPFTYHGFRYCYVTGIDPEQATEDLIEFIVLHNDVPVLADFNCSDGISNEIFSACRRSDESNLMNVITDCPAREKNGWTGDAAISAEHYLFNLGVDNVFADYLACVRAAMDEDGALPLVVPSSQNVSKCPVWDSVLAFLSYYSYKYRGRLDILENNADAIMKNLRRNIELLDERGICDAGLGDWLAPGLEAGEYYSALGFCNSFILMEICTLSEQIMTVLGRLEDADYCRDRYSELRRAAREEYLVGSTVTAGKDKKYAKPHYRPCQTSQVLALHCGLLDESEIAEAVNILVEMIRNNGGSFDCGFLGMRYIFPILSRYGYSELAYKMITRPMHPSYANMIYRGETTVPERFCAPGERMGSHNHHFMAGISAWYLEYAVGIRVNPSFTDPNHVTVEPHFISALDFCEGSYKTVGGEVKVSWERSDEDITVKIATSGEVRLGLGEGLKEKEGVRVYVNGELLGK